MMKAMLSQPMAGKTDKEIIETRERAMSELREKGYEIVNTLFTDEWYSRENMEKRGVVQIPLCFLAKSLENMSLCHYHHHFEYMHRHNLYEPTNVLPRMHYYLSYFLHQ